MMSMKSRAIDTTIVHIGRGTTHQALSVIPLPSLALSRVSQLVCVAPKQPAPASRTLWELSIETGLGI